MSSRKSLVKRYAAVARETCSGSDEVREYLYKVWQGLGEGRNKFSDFEDFLEQVEDAL